MNKNTFESRIIERVHAVYPNHQELFSKPEYTGLINNVTGGLERMLVSAVGRKSNAWEATAIVVNKICAAISEPLYTSGYCFKKVGQWSNKSRGTIDLNDPYGNVISDITFNEFSALLKVLFVVYSSTAMSEEQYNAYLDFKSIDKFYRLLD